MGQSHFEQVLVASQNGFIFLNFRGWNSKRNILKPPPIATFINKKNVQAIFPWLASPPPPKTVPMAQILGLKTTLPSPAIAL